MKYTYINSEKSMSEYLLYLEEEKVSLLAFDIEGESNLHEYGEKLCLMQCYDGKTAVIIDPFTTPIHLIKALLENRSCMKIMYDAAGDRAFLYKNCGIDVLTVLDLQAAVNILHYEPKDLASVLKQALQVETGKSKKKYQQYNWNKRPIAPEALEYAIDDVAYLFRLKDALMKEIIEKGLLDQFLIKNIQAQNKPHRYDKRPKLLRSGEYKKLTVSEQKLFSELFSIRDTHARDLNLPPNRVIANDVLFELVQKKKTIDVVLENAHLSVARKKEIIELVSRLLPSQSD